MSPLPYRREKSTAEEVEGLLAKVEIKRGAEGGCTLLTAPVIVVRGMHRDPLELLDQNGRKLGSANPRPPVDWSYELSYELCDTDSRCVLIVHKFERSLRERLKGAWAYELFEPGDPRIITVSCAERWEDATIADGPHQIGLLRSGTGRCLFSVQDEPGHILGRVLLARQQFFDRFALVVEVENRTPDQLRKVAVAASVIADREMIASGGGGAAGA
jgi:hypothetical protein